jgi:zinc transport system substrate-binding protein
METISEHNVKAIFTEPQLPTAAADTISEETGLPIVVIDPIGGYEGRGTYFDLIRYNTLQFVNAFSQNG